MNDVKTLEDKFNTNFHDYYWFKCGIEELRRSTIFNQQEEKLTMVILLFMKTILKF